MEPLAENDLQMRAACRRICEEVSLETGVSVAEMMANTMNERKPSAARREAQRRMLAVVPGMYLGRVAEFFGKDRRRVRRSVLFRPDAGRTPLDELVGEMFRERGFEWTLAGMDGGKLLGQLSETLDRVEREAGSSGLRGRMTVTLEVSPAGGDRVEVRCVVDVTPPS